MRAIALILALAATTAQAQQLGFKGLPMGAERQQLLEAFPSMQCNKTSPQFRTLGEEHCASSASFCSQTDCTASRQALSTYAGMPAWDVNFSIVEGRVAGFNATVANTSYEAVRDAMREVYGKGKEEIEEVQTMGGAKLPARIWEAKSAGGTITLFERAARLNQGFVTMKSAELLAWQKKGPDAKKGSKDL